jgi:hypothetical protein
LVQIVASGVQVPPALRLVVIGSDRANPEQLALWQRALGTRVTLINAYGLTETTITSLMYEVPSPAEFDIEVPIGQPLPDTEAYVLDEQLQPVPIGVVGELYLGGTGLARGYLARPALTAERFLPDPFATAPGARLYRTGDLVRWRADGMLAFVGRADSQLKVRGYRIEPGEIEAVLQQHPQVAEAAVALRSAPGGEPRLVAYVVGVAGAAGLEQAALRGWLLQQLPAYMVPAVVVVLPALPRTPAGKLDRAKLPAPEAEADAVAPPHVPPTSSLELLIAGVWQDVLGVTQVGLHDNFFDLGGHSLLLLRVQYRLQELLARPITMIDLFRYPTIHSLAATLGQQQAPKFTLAQIEDRAAKQRAAAHSRILLPRPNRGS